MPLRRLRFLLLAVAACGDQRVTAPAEASAFRRFIAIGTGLTMGEQSAGVVYESQVASWPSQLAARMDAPFRVPALRAPGCTPPLVAPLVLNRTLAGDAAADAAGCSGRLGSDSLPANIVAMVGATAWDALHTSPRSFVTQAASLDQLRYPMILPAQQTQLQSMQAHDPTLVAVELGAGEVMRAATTGLVVLGTSYTQKTPWTLMPASVFTPVFDSIADSVAATGARVVYIGVPPLASLPAWRAGDALWQDRAALAAYGINVATDCQGSGNLLNVAALLPPLAASARTAGTSRALNCADQPGVADFVLTAADASLILQTTTALNAAIKAAAAKRQAAYVDVPAYWSGPTGAPPFSAAGVLGSDTPFGVGTSLDGIQPSSAGQRRLADAVAAALNATFKWAIPVTPAAP